MLEKLRGGVSLTAKETVIHEHGLLGVPKSFHDELGIILQTYGWPRGEPLPVLRLPPLRAPANGKEQNHVEASVNVRRLVIPRRKQRAGSASCSPSTRAS